MRKDEASILGQIILKNEIFHSLRITSEHLLREDNKRIFCAIGECISKGIYADLMTIAATDEHIDKAYLASLTDIGSTANWKWYEGRIIRAWKQWRLNYIMLALGDAIKSDADPDVTIAEIERVAMEIAKEGGRAQIERIGDIAKQYMIDLEERAKTSPGELLGLSSHINKLDEITNGWKPRDLIYIGARPSEGKSALALNLASHLILEKDTSCGIISLESSSKELVKRLYISEGGVASRKLQTAQLTASDIMTLVDFSGTIFDKKLVVYDGTNINIAQLRSVARAMVTMHGIKALFIDYLQLIRGTDKRMGKTEIVGENSTLLKELARELEIPVICLAQLKRPEKHGDAPDLDSFQWASQIEQDADICILIHHAEDGSWLLCKKVRDGECGGVPVHFHRDRVKFFPRQP
jgi:replicative DNA helicase